MDKNEKQHKCSECGRTYEYYYNLRKHVMTSHPGKINEVAPPKKGQKLKAYQCHLCDKKFTMKQNLKSHMLKLHASCLNIGKDEENVETLAGLKDVSITSEDRHFSSFSSFLEWKLSIENKTKFCFVKKRGFYIAANKKRKYYYVCHRSGFFVSESKGIRRMRKGSVKIDGICPASMKVTEHEDGTCTVHYITTHSCRQKELHNLDLTDLERKTVATDIASHIPFDIVLDKIRDSVIGKQLAKIHLITKEELRNIKNNFNLSSKSMGHQEDGLNIEAWVNKVNADDHPCVLFYKSRGTVSEKHPTLSSNDFLLIIMNYAQCEILKKYGSDLICIDRIYELDECGFQLITLLVVDGLKQGFPCTFMISNRNDQEILSVLFMYIKAEVGYISPKVFMSDLSEELFFNAWCAVMGPATIKLNSSWCVDRSWRKSIQSKINKAEIQTKVYKMLRLLLQENDKVAFERFFSLVVSYLRDDPDTLNFAEYFQENYTNNVSSWAHCYHISNGLNTNMHLEKIHDSIKYIALQCSHEKSLKDFDKAVYMLMHFVRDNFFYRVITLFKGKHSNMMKEIKRRHETSLKMCKDVIITEENGWKIESSSSDITDECFVNKIGSDCNCGFICSDCGSCIHIYSCSCLDSSVKWNMCKHIHSICQLNQIQPQESNADLMTIEFEEELIDHDEAEILNQISYRKLPDQLLQNEKEKIKNRLINLIDGLSTSEEIDVLKNHTASLEATINIVRSQAKSETFRPETAHMKRTIEPEEKLFNPTRKRLAAQITLTKTNRVEVQNIPFTR